MMVGIYNDVLKRYQLEQRTSIQPLPVSAPVAGVSVPSSPAGQPQAPAGQPQAPRRGPTPVSVPVSVSSKPAGSAWQTIKPEAPKHQTDDTIQASVTNTMVLSAPVPFAWPNSTRPAVDEQKAPSGVDGHEGSDGELDFSSLSFLGDDDDDFYVPAPQRSFAIDASEQWASDGLQLQSVESAFAPLHNDGWGSTSTARDPQSNSFFFALPSPFAQATGWPGCRQCMVRCD
jgi:hypothetical protein